MILEMGIILGLMALAGSRKKPPATNTPAGNTQPTGGTAGGPDPGASGGIPPNDVGKVMPGIDGGNPIAPPDPRFYPPPVDKPTGGPGPISPAKKGIHLEQVTEGGRTVRELVNGNKVLTVYSSQRTDAAGNPQPGGKTTTGGKPGQRTYKPM